MIESGVPDNMNTLIVKYQLIMLVVIIAITTSLITGINKGRVLNTKIDLDPSITSMSQPINWQIQNQKTTALLNNQNMFQSIFSPKDFIAPDKKQNAESIPVLLYHGVTEKPDGENVTIDQFRAHLITLKKAGYTTVTLDQFQKFNKGEIELPQKSFLLTFDDGRKDSFYNVDPILESLNYTAVSYIITTHSISDQNSSYYLNKNEIKAMQKTGRWEIGSHSQNAHRTIVISETGEKGTFFGNKMWLEENKRLETDTEYKQRIMTDLTESKKELERLLGNTVSSVALPFGDYGQNSKNYYGAPVVMKEISSSIYPVVMYQVWSENSFNESIFNYPNPKNNMMKRIDVKSNWEAEKLLNVLSAHQDKPLTFNDRFDKDNGWVKNWGEMNLENNALYIGSNDTSNGSLVFLSGGQNWSNYLYKAYIDWLSGEDVTIVARFKDSKNFASCRVGSGQVTITQRINGEDTILKTVKKDFPLQLYGGSLEVRVKDTTISCFVEGEEIASTDNLSPILNQGTIGMASWDRNPHNSAILIKHVYVEQIN